MVYGQLVVFRCAGSVSWPGEGIEKGQEQNKNENTEETGTRFEGLYDFLGSLCFCHKSVETDMITFAF